MGAGAVRSRALGGSLGWGRAGGSLALCSDTRVRSTLMHSQLKERIYFLTQSYGLLARW